MALYQYADDLIAKSFKVPDLYDEDTLDDVFIEVVDISIRQSLENYWTSNPQTDLTDIEFQT